MDKDNLPNVSEIKNHMQFLSKLLYKTWKMELAQNLRSLKFKGEISVLNYHPDIGRLPNEYVKSALAQIQDELDVLEYDYKFKFDNVIEENKWVLVYEVELPEESSEDHCNFYEGTDFFTKDDPKVEQYLKKFKTLKRNSMGPSTFSDKNVCTKDIIDENDTFFFEKDYTYLKTSL